MSKVRAQKRGGVCIMLPQRFAVALRIEEGGYVDVEEVSNGILLKPLSPTERRKAALKGIRGLQARVRPAPQMKQLSPEEQEEAIAAWLGEDDA